MVKMTKIKIYTFLLLLLSATAFAQQNRVQSGIDSTKIRIGSQFNLTIKATVDTSARVSFPEGKNFGQLEVLESYPVDTVKNGALYELVKKYGLTQFDSGRYVIPPLPVIINNQNFRTDSLAIEVANIEVDTIKQQLFDIKPVIQAQSQSRWWIYVIIFLALVAAGFGAWWYLRKRKKTPKAAVPVYATPIEKATAQLKNLERKGLLEKGEVKDYYSELTDIARTYIEEAIHVPAMESTTSELIEAMRIAVLKKKMRLTQETFEQLEKVLRNADMVKFAKSRPLDFEINEDRSRIEKTIVVIDKSIPEEKEDDDDHTQKWLEIQQKKKKRNRIIAVSAVAVFILLATAVYFSAVKGVGFLRDNVLGHPTKELLEGEWVTSEYGEPPIQISTPKVLRRYNEPEVESNLPPNVKAYQKFIYGTLMSDLSVILTATALNEPLEIDAENVINNNLLVYEKTASARDIILKSDEFSNENGISGRRAYGTMMIKDPLNGKEKKVSYNMLVFSQKSAVQEVIILHNDGDENAEKITEKIINSIGLTKINQ